MTGINIPAFHTFSNRQTDDTENEKKPNPYYNNEEDFKAINAALGTATKAQSILSIGNGVDLSGKVVAADQVIVHGIVDAEINANSVEVMADGSLTGTIKTNAFSVSGTFTGNAQVSGNLKIQNGGSIEGDIAYGSLSVENGGLLYGNLSKPAEIPPVKAASIIREETKYAQAAQ
ncbi:polymer-forming cytoskeletal protein [Alphaproteobacteria bacterium]|nr:polymer-forming cytoskeletal protein [Alphaproteobacteria bacterium]